KSLLVFCFDSIVQLLAKAEQDLVEERSRLHPPRAGKIDNALQHRNVLEIALNGFFDASVLYLDGHGGSVVQCCPVHLPDGGAGNRFFVEGGKDLERPLTELIDESLVDILER